MDNLYIKCLTKKEIDIVFGGITEKNNENLNSGYVIPITLLGMAIGITLLMYKMLKVMKDTTVM